MSRKTFTTGNNTHSGVKSNLIIPPVLTKADNRGGVAVLSVQTKTQIELVETSHILPK